MTLRSALARRVRNARRSDLPELDGAVRGQSTTIGVVLLLGIAAMGTTAVVVFGADALDAAEQQMRTGNAEQAITKLDSTVGLVAHGLSDSQSVGLPTAASTTTTVYEDRGWMNVTIVNATDGTIDTVVMNQTLGAVVYETGTGNASVAYQGGGVWRQFANGGQRMVSPPAFQYRAASNRNPTLTLSVVTINGSGTLGGEARITQPGDVQGKYPSGSLSNPLENGKVNVTVKSKYYEAWGQFFEQRTSGDVTYNHGIEQVSITLKVPSSSSGNKITGAIVSGAASSTLTIQNQGGLDSYNSSAGDYGATSKKNTTVVSAGDIKLQNQALTEGDIEAGGSVTLQNKAEVTGNVSYGGTLSKHKNAIIGGWSEDNASVTTPQPVETLIDDKRTSFDGPGSDNAAEPHVNNLTNRLTGCTPTCDLDAGDYYLSKVALGTGDTLVLDTSGGEVEVVVDGDLTWEGQSKIKVTGGGTARFYIEGSATIQNKANATVPGERSPGLWLYMNPSESADFNNQARFVGVVYGPGSGGSGGVDIGLNNKIDIFGGLVGKVDAVQNKMGIHFDEALVGQDPRATGGGGGSSAPSITYLHVSTVGVNVTAV